MKDSPKQRRGEGCSWSSREFEAKNNKYLDREVERRVWEQLLLEEARWANEGKKRGAVTRRREGCPGPMTEEVRGVSNGREV